MSLVAVWGFPRTVPHNGGWSEDMTGVINIPVLEDTLAFRIAATYEDTAGWIDQVDRSGIVIDEDINDREVSNIRLKALWAAHRCIKPFYYGNPTP